MKHHPLATSARIAVRGLLPLALCLAGPAAQASCGAASCNLLNDRFALGTWEHAGWSVDLRLESVTQDQLRAGTKH